jgi:predicted AlkP superfamily phosphohydrolase/phosphomutase
MSLSALLREVLEMLVNKVLVIGLDGAEPELLDRWINRGYLPNLASIQQSGVYGRLRSTMPPVSPAAWSTFMTGVNPGKHGVYDFTVRDFATYGVRITRRPRVPSLWRLLSDQDKSVCVVNVPQSYPPEEVNGIVVTGLGTPAGSVFTYPSVLSKSLEQKGFRFVTSQSVRTDGPDAFLTGVYEVADTVVTTAIQVFRQIDWDFGMVVLRLTDEIPHYFWHNMDPNHPSYPGDENPHRDVILDCYRRADRMVGDLVRQAADDNTVVFVVSDHGFGPLHQDVYLNEWLRQEGFLTVSKSPGNEDGQGLFRRLGLTHAQLGALLGRLGLNKTRAFLRDRLGKLASVLPADDQLHVSDVVDWANTRAYSIGYMGQIYLNVKGRDPAGVVMLGEDYEAVCADLIARLRSWRHPVDGQPIVDEVYRRDQIYEGCYRDQGPDLLVMMRGLTYITRQNREFGMHGRVFVDPSTGETATHRMDGVFLASGPNIRQDQRIGTSQIDAVAPTILYLLDCQVPSYMDGKVIHAALEPKHWRATPVAYFDSPAVKTNVEREQGGLSDGEQREVIDQLRRLGYIE